MQKTKQNKKDAMFHLYLKSICFQVGRLYLQAINIADTSFSLFTTPNISQHCVTIVWNESNVAYIFFESQMKTVDELFC